MIANINTTAGLRRHLDREFRLRPRHVTRILGPNNPDRLGPLGNSRDCWLTKPDAAHNTGEFQSHTIYRLDRTGTPEKKAAGEAHGRLDGVWNGTGYTLSKNNFALVFKVDPDPDDALKRYIAWPYELKDCEQGDLNIGAGTELTIATDTISKTGSKHRLRAESGTTDDLATINGGLNGDILALFPISGHTITVKDGTDNIRLNGDFAMDSVQDRIVLEFNGSNWIEWSRSDNG